MTSKNHRIITAAIPDTEMAQCDLATLQVCEASLAILADAIVHIQVLHAHVCLTLCVEHTTVIGGRDVGEPAV